MAEHRRVYHAGFTIIEILVVTAICIIMMTVLTTMYTGSLRIYRESQGTQAVYDTSRLINQELRNYLSNVIPVRADWIEPKHIGLGSSADNVTNIDRYYLDSKKAEGFRKSELMQNDVAYDYFFSKAQYPPAKPSDINSNIGYDRNSQYNQMIVADPNYNDPLKPPGVIGWWLPAFFGKRKNITDDNVVAGSWGWPRADYRMDVDLDDPNHENVTACWFYAENGEFNSPKTMALDNANIVLVSMKFTKKIDAVTKSEMTHLSFLRHQIVGFDNSTAVAKHDPVLNNMLRKIKITPYTMEAGLLVEMGDEHLGSDKLTGAQLSPTKGNAVPRCFDIEYSLRSPSNEQRYDFALRIYCAVNPQ